MVSTYGYTTLATLEKHAKRDYSAIEATIFADANVEQAITDAEITINGYVGTIFTGTIPPDIALCTCRIAKTFLDNIMLERGIGGVELEAMGIQNIYYNPDIVMVLEKYRALYSANRSVFISKHSHVGATGIYTRPWSYT